MAASAEYTPRSRIERLESLIKKVRSLATSALALVSGFHAPVASVATTNVVALAGIQAIDGVAGAAGQRVLLANQTVPSQNGIWVQAAGAWTRPADWQAASVRAAGEVVNVAPGGTTFARFGACWRLTNTITVDAPASDPIIFPREDKGTGILDIALVDRWVFAGAVATAVDTTVGAVAALNVTAVVPGAGDGRANGALTIDGTAGHSAAFVILNF